MRYALGVEYDGAGFYGWQIQSRARSVQECLEKALSDVADHAVQTSCAGRTDRGVHGIGQVAHFDSIAERSLRSWLLGANTGLPADISIQWIKEVPDDFHARFTAQARHYRYVICNRLARSALDRHRAAWTHKALDAEHMHQAARHLLGEHDFSSYRAAGCQASHANRYVYHLTVQRNGDRIILDIVANAFLHHMVRNIVGVLMAIGRGDRGLDWTRALLDARDRKQAGVTAPPQGLYFMGVYYPPQFGLAWSGSEFELNIESRIPRKTEA